MVFRTLFSPPGSFLQQDPCAYIFFFLKLHHPETAFMKFSPADSWITLGKEKGILFSSMEDFWEGLLCVCQYIRSRLWCVVEVTVLPSKNDLVSVIENILQVPCNYLGLQRFITYLISIENYKFLDSISTSSICGAFSYVLLHHTSLLRKMCTAPTMCQTLFTDNLFPHRMPLSSSNSCSNRTMRQLSQPCHAVPKTSVALLLCSSLFVATPSWHNSSLALNWMT